MVAVEVERDWTLPQQIPIDLVFAQDVQGLAIPICVLEPCQRPLAVDRERLGEAALHAVPVDEQRLLHISQNLEIAVLGNVVLEQLKTEAMDRPNEHLTESKQVAEFSLDARRNSAPQFDCGLLGERESDDVLGLETMWTACVEQVRNAPRENLGLPRSGARDQLQITARVLNRLPLSRRRLVAGRRHRSLARRWSPDSV